MSSVPVQFLIYVKGPPACSTPPTMVPLSTCLEVQVGVSKVFNVSAQNMCNPSISTVTDINPSSPINGLNSSALRNATIGGSIAYVTFNWIPQINQIGSQQICFVAYTRYFMRRY